MLLLRRDSKEYIGVVKGRDIIVYYIVEAFNGKNDHIIC